MGRKNQEAEGTEVAEVAEVSPNAEQSREAIAIQIAEMKAAQAAQREAMKAQREEALVKLKEQREAMKAQREALKIELDAKKAAAKAEREAERASKNAEKIAKETEKLQKRAERDAARLEREKARLAALQEKVNNPQVEQNGIRRPKDGTKCGIAWQIFDEMSTAKGAAVAISEVLTRAMHEGLNEGNVRAEYSRWRRFHGIIGRVTVASNQESQQAA